MIAQVQVILKSNYHAITTTTLLRTENYKDRSFHKKLLLYSIFTISYIDMTFLRVLLKSCGQYIEAIGLY
jgi:hypothetical protein